MTAISQIAELHSPVLHPQSAPEGRPICAECVKAWPCPTTLALRDLIPGIRGDLIAVLRSLEIGEDDRYLPYFADRIIATIYGEPS